MDQAGDTAQLEISGHIQSSAFMGLTCEHTHGRPQVAVVGVPWDGGTVGHPGARLGPAAIRQASRRLRRVHYAYGFSPFDLCRMVDVGDVVVNPFNRTAALEAIERFYRRLAQFQVAPISIGGDHLVTLPILRAIARNQPVGLVHFDAHFDVAESSADEGEPYTSATPFRRAIEEGLIDPGRMVQIGIRSTLRTLEMAEWADTIGIRTISMDEFHHIGPAGVIDETRRLVGKGPIYITLDVDALDPAFVPGTGAPVIGGLSTGDVQRVLRGLREADVIGGDVVEVSPPYDVNGISALVGASLTFELLCLAASASQRRQRSQKEMATSNTH